MAYAPKIEWAKQWLSETKKPYINGQFVHGSGKVMESINPATNEVIGTFDKAIPHTALEKNHRYRIIEQARDSHESVFMRNALRQAEE